MFFKPDDIKDLDYNRDLGDPGVYPYTRGIYPTMYAGRLWTMRQYAGYGTAEESNRRYRYLLGQGQTGISVAFDLPTQMGYDSDNPMAEGEIGKTGVAIDTIDDMARLFDGIPLGRVSTSMTINATAAVMLAMYAAVAENNGVAPEQLEGTVQNDILKEYIARGTYIYPAEPSLRLVIDLVEYCRHHLPKWNTISISGYHIREAGADAVQEISFTLANGIAYVEAARARGLDVDSFAPRLSFFFNAHNDFLEEVAKFRAARRIWARIMRERFHARDPKSWSLRFHTQTAGSTLTAREPENNAIRVAFQALASVLGGTQSLHTNSFDEALALPGEAAAKLALRTQQLIAYETGVAAVADPLAGSYCIEALTNRVEQAANGYLAQIEALGGSVAAIEKGFFQKEIHARAYAYQQDVERGKASVVGVNRFTSGVHRRYERLSVKKSAVTKQLRRLAAVKASRDNGRVQALLEDLRHRAAGRDNLVEGIVPCVKAHATVGEISDVLREVYGEYKEKSIF